MIAALLVTGAGIVFVGSFTDLLHPSEYTSERVSIPIPDLAFTQTGQADLNSKSLSFPQTSSNVQRKAEVGIVSVQANSAASGTVLPLSKVDRLRATSTMHRFADRVFSASQATDEPLAASNRQNQGASVPDALDSQKREAKARPIELMRSLKAATSNSVISENPESDVVSGDTSSRQTTVVRPALQRVKIEVFHAARAHVTALPRSLSEIPSPQREVSFEALVWDGLLTPEGKMRRADGADLSQPAVSSLRVPNLVVGLNDNRADQIAAPLPTVGIDLPVLFEITQESKIATSMLRQSDGFPQLSLKAPVLQREFNLTLKPPTQNRLVTPDPKARASSDLSAVPGRSAIAIYSPALSRSISRPRQTRSGVEFEVSTRIGGAAAGRLPLVIVDGDMDHPEYISEEIAVRLSDIISLLSSRMESGLLNKLSCSKNAQQYVTFNELRSCGISVRFDDRDNLVLKVL